MLIIVVAAPSLNVAARCAAPRMGFAPSPKELSNDPTIKETLAAAAVERAEREARARNIKSEALPFMARPLALDGSMPGDVGFDPIGFTSLLPLGFLREAELKHGRVCMLATVGWIATDLGLRAPGLPADSPLMSVSSFAAHNLAVQQGPMIALLFVVGVLEIAGFAAVQQTLKGERTPGDFALSIGGPPSSTLLLQEVKHSRLAMLAFSGIVTQCAVTHGTVGFPYF